MLGRRTTLLSTPGERDELKYTSQNVHRQLSLYSIQVIWLRNRGIAAFEGVMGGLSPAL